MNNIRLSSFNSWCSIRNKSMDATLNVVYTNVINRINIICYKVQEGILADVTQNILGAIAESLNK